jgi:hypothetical protein
LSAVAPTTGDASLCALVAGGFQIAARTDGMGDDWPLSLRRT